MPEAESGALCINFSACIGGFVGLGLGIWAAVEYLEPAFNETHGINDAGAKALTALVAVGGGLETAAGAGALAGILASTVVISMLACCYCCGVSASNCATSCTNSKHNATTNPSVSNHPSAMMYTAPDSMIETRATTGVMIASAV